ncbi:MAG: hypothetical protein PHF35_01490 [Candidatus Moranbacteria bacterium]|nr:hypothetical protein [Candidatus Moranbacteria bacterium]
METLHSKNLTKDNSAGKAVQSFVDIAEIKDGVVILKNGTLRAVLMVSSINFDLKSSQEQEAIVANYQSFLNSVDFPIQIVVSSRKMDINPYLETLSIKEKEQPNELLRFQIAEYRDFVKNMVDASNIMAKSFFIIIPFALTEAKKEGFVDRIRVALNPQQIMLEKKMEFENYKSQLWQRVDHVMAGLGGTGIRMAPLSTEELIELYYNSYNPGVTENTDMISTDELNISAV